MKRPFLIKHDGIFGVETFFPPQFEDERGRVQRMCRIDDPHIEPRGMGEIYFSTVYPGAVKAWHLHKEMWLRYACVYGMVVVGLYDDRENSPTRGNSMICHLDMIGDLYTVLCIPPLVWNGFRCDLDWDKYSIIANCASQPYRPNEIERMKIEDAPFKFNWGEYKVSG